MGRRLKKITQKKAMKKTGREETIPDRAFRFRFRFSAANTLHRASSAFTPFHPACSYAHETKFTPATYSKMFLFVTSSEGSSSLRVTMTYADSTDVVSITVPDYYVDIPANDPVVFNLASNLPKWTQQNTVAAIKVPIVHKVSPMALPPTHAPSQVRTGKTSGLFPGPIRLGGRARATTSNSVR